MSSAFYRTAVLSVLVVMAAVPARAQDIFATPFAGVKFGGDTSIYDLELAAGQRAFAIGVSLTVLGDGVIGYEADFGYVPDYFQNDESLPLIKVGSYAIDLTGAVVFALPAGVTGGGLRPYAVVGAGLISAQAEDFLEIFQIRRTVPAYKIGFGVQGLLTTIVGVRLDVRHVRSFTGDDGSLAEVGRRISYSRITLGLMLKL